MTLYTIGTSDRSAEAFLEAIARRDVWLLVDVRSSPRSRSAWANRGPLEVAAVRHGIHYSWAGGILGGRNPILTTARDFQMAAEQLLDAADRGPVAIFCAEGDPARCHRSYKVAAHLLVKHSFVASNILRDGTEEDVSATLRRTAVHRLPQCLRTEVQELLRA